MSLNEELIRTRCQEIEESLGRLEKIRDISKEDFLKNQDTQDIACYRLLVAIEAALGLCYHVAARHLKKVPQEYAECFGILADAGIIATDLSESLKKMARFRNLLVHMYWKVEYGTLYELIQYDLGDLRRFSKSIVALL
ncbi:MAG: hypothetical protein A2170_09225 [Deltaproteobacteria bacterium RBG_13_53_10]|nr:MAG: hypothetical protein A2170_09225 [Deltaproteobacteria bacterium RBG_13_53_10]